MSITTADPQVKSEPKHTIPTQEELAVMMKDAPYFVAGARDGSQFIECYVLDEGIAFRRFGSEDNNDWKWLRDTDFSRVYIGYYPIDMKKDESDLVTLIRWGSTWKARARDLYNCLGKKGRARLGEKIASNILKALK